MESGGGFSHCDRDARCGGFRIGSGFESVWLVDASVCHLKEWFVVVSFNGHEVFVKYDISAVEEDVCCGVSYSVALDPIRIAHKFTFS
jgi:hypothetical protein